MKKLLAFALATVLLLSVTACGKHGDGGAGTTTTTTVADGTTSTTGVSTTPTATEGTSATVTTTTTTAAPTTTVPTHAIVTVPIGTKPTTTTQQPTTTTTQVEEPVGPTTTVTNTTTTTTTTTTPTTTAKPTEPAGPYIELPAVGTDIDVSKQKNRIRVSDVAAWLNADGSIGVALTFRNYSANWITEETDYVEYTCYDKDGKVVQRATKIMIGVIDTKKYVSKTFEFSVPANTAEVRLTRSKITYWTEWV